MFNLFGKKPAVNQTPTNTQRVKFQISGMHCTSCSLNIDGELEELGGVKSATTSFAKSTTVVEYDPEKVSEEVLKKTIEKLGYAAHEHV